MRRIKFVNWLHLPQAASCDDHRGHTTVSVFLHAKLQPADHMPRGCALNKYKNSNNKNEYQKALYTYAVQPSQHSYCKAAAADSCCGRGGGGRHHFGDPTTQE